MFFAEIMKDVNKLIDKKKSQKKHAIFEPYFYKYYNKIKSLKTVHELEVYRKSLPDPNSTEIKILENQTGRNIIHEARRWIDDDIKRLNTEFAILQEKRKKEERIKKERDLWAEEPNKIQKSKGFVYIFFNVSMPTLIKIGYSTKMPHERANELYTTGVPTPFTVLHAWGTPTEIIAKNLESQIHQKFANSRLHGNREFFNIDCLQNVKLYLEKKVGKEITFN
jgi:hypothetical protein